MSWIALVALGTGLCWLMVITPKKGDDILSRLAALVFLAAGTVGATGWMGSIIAAIMGWLKSAGDAMGGAVVGSSVTWIIAVAIFVGWCAAFLPNRYTRYQMRSWMIYAGLFIPSLLATVPGGLGAALRTFVYWVGHGTDQWVYGLVA